MDIPYDKSIYNTTRPDGIPVIRGTIDINPHIRFDGLEPRDGVDNQGFFQRREFDHNTKFPIITTQALPIPDNMAFGTRPNDLYYQDPYIEVRPPSPINYITNTELNNLLYNIYSDGVPKYQMQQQSGANELHERTKYMNQLDGLERILNNNDQTIANSIGAKQKYNELLEKIKLSDPTFYMTIQTGKHQSNLENLNREMIRLNEEMKLSNMNTADIQLFSHDTDIFLKRIQGKDELDESQMYQLQRILVSMEDMVKRPNINKGMMNILLSQRDQLKEELSKTTLTSTLKEEKEAEEQGELYAGGGIGLLIEEESESMSEFLTRGGGEFYNKYEKLIQLAPLLFDDEAFKTKVEEVKKVLTIAMEDAESKEEEAIFETMKKELDESMTSASRRSSVEELPMEELPSEEKLPTEELPSEELPSEELPPTEEEKETKVSEQQKMLEQYKDTINSLSDDGKAFLMTKLRRAGLKGNMTSMIDTIISSGDLDQLNTLDEFIAEASKIEPEKKSKKLVASSIEPPSYEEVTTTDITGMNEKDRNKYNEKEKKVIKSVKILDDAEMNETQLESELQRGFKYETFIPALMRYMKLKNIPSETRKKVGSSLLKQDRLSNKVVKTIIENNITDLGKGLQAQLLKDLEFIFTKKTSASP